MYACRASETDVDLSNFSEFHKSLLELANSYKETQLKIEDDLDSEIIKIFGEKISSLSRAKNGLEDVLEMAYTTAEHHPFWNLLYQSSQISKTLLEKWNEELSSEDSEEIKWAIKELKHSIEKLSK